MENTTQQLLTQLSLVSFLLDIGNQCRPGSDAAICSVWLGSPLFAYRMFYWNLNKNEKHLPTILATEKDWSKW